MSDDFYTEETSEGWLSRLGGSIKGILFGLVLCVVSVPLHYWNEGRAVETSRALEEGASTVVSIGPDLNNIDPGLQGKLVHLSGLAQGQGTINDPQFELSMAGIGLRRSVEMYQWTEEKEKESKKKLGGGKTTKTTYSYEKSWESSIVDSSDFKVPEGHQNPGSLPVTGQSFRASSVAVGPLKLSPKLIGKIGGAQPLALKAEAMAAAQQKYRGQVFGDTFYIGQDPNAPKVGDVRITWSHTGDAEVSVVAKLHQGTLDAFVTSGGGSVELLSMGVVSSEKMFSDAEAANALMTWILRGVGFLMMLIGFMSIFKPLSVVADVVPFIGNIVEFGTGLVAFALAAPLTLVVIAVCWIVHRPILGVGLLVAALAMIVGLKMLMSKRKAA